jgi:hypothetical protein
MKQQLMALVASTTLLVAAAPAPPVITLDGISVAARLSPELRTAIAPHVKALNAGLERIVALQAGLSKATAEQRAQKHEAMKTMHEDCRKLHEEIVEQLDPEQRAAFFQYLHEQMKAAGIQMPHPPHGERAHPPHGDRTHPPHRGTHADPWTIAA